MKKSTKTKIQESKTETRSSSRIKQKTKLNNINQSAKTTTRSTKKAVVTVKNKPVTRTTNNTAAKRLSVLATKIRQQKSKPVTDTPKTKLNQDTPTVKNNKKLNESPVKVNDKRQIKKVTTVSTPVTRKSAQDSLKKNIDVNKRGEINNTASTNLKTLDKENITPRKERLTQRIKKLNTKKNVKNTLTTPVNKKQSIDVVHTRVLRKRNNLIPNKYKDISLLSPLKKPEKPKSSNPLDVYDFEIDSSEEKNNKQKKSDSDSSGEEDNSMKVILKKIRKVNKKATIKKQKKIIKNKPETIVQKKETNAKSDKPVVNNEQKNKLVTTEQKKATNNNQKVLIPIIEIQPVELPSISINEIEMVTISDHSNPENHSEIDPSIQARNIVAEVTKSFIEDLSDEEPEIRSPGKVKVLSNVVIRNAKSDTNKKIFNSTVNGLKPPKPWRIDVSGIRRKPQYFTYKDKSFTPRYEPELEPITLPKEIEQNNKNTENNKPTHQTSILDFIKGSKPKIIENKINELFVEPPQKNVQSPRKVLGEINFVQSTPLRTNNKNAFKSPNVSIISPKKRTEDLFGFSYFSDDENKENLRRSPRKNNNKVIVKQTEEIVQQKEPEKNVEENSVSEQQSDFDVNEITVPLFQDIDEKLDVSKKSTRKYIRKNPKRKRLPSVDTIPSDDESEPEPEVHEKKKRKNARTKEEELEADRLASHYNSMFEEIEKYPLVIE